jgi:hypothetical protein
VPEHFFARKDICRLQLVLKNNSIIMKNIGRFNFTTNMNAVYFVGGTTQFLCIVLVISSLKDKRIAVTFKICSFHYVYMFLNSSTLVIIIIMLSMLHIDKHKSTDNSTYSKSLV